MLALRDELASRAFDLPGAWWADQPDVIGGRDRTAGGSWCVSAVPPGVTSVVLNAPQKPIADPGAPSRGVLPLAAARHGERWPEHLDVAGMASFNLVLATPRELVWWRFDGERLTREALGRGTYLFTPGGLPAAGVDAGFTEEPKGFSGDLGSPTEQAWSRWLRVVRESVPTSDPSGLLVRKPVDGGSFETVFGQFIAARPATLRLDYVTSPAAGQPWKKRLWTGEPGSSEVAPVG